MATKLNAKTIFSLFSAANSSRLSMHFLTAVITERAISVYKKLMNSKLTVRIFDIKFHMFRVFIHGLVNFLFGAHRCKKGNTEMRSISQNLVQYCLFFNSQFLLSTLKHQVMTVTFEGKSKLNSSVCSNQRLTFPFSDVFINWLFPLTNLNSQLKNHNNNNSNKQDTAPKFEQKIAEVFKKYYQNVKNVTKTLFTQLLFFTLSKSFLKLDIKRSQLKFRKKLSLCRYRFISAKRCNFLMLQI